MKASRSDDATRSMVAVRQTVWLIFSVAVLLALALPVASVVQQRAVTLQAHAAVWPAQPQVGAAAHLIVSLTNANDQAAVGGPWARLEATWNMPAMAMGPHQATVQGTTNGQGTFVVPLQLDMAGQWSIQVSLQTPGRPTWRGYMTITALPGNAGTASVAT